MWIIECDLELYSAKLFYSMKVQLALEGNFVEWFKDEAEERIAGVFNHMKTFYQHSSLQVKFNLIKLPPKRTKQKLQIVASNRE